MIKTTTKLFELSVGDTLEKCEGDLSDDDDGNQNIPQYNRGL